MQTQELSPDRAPNRALFIQHQPDAPPGYVGERLQELGMDLDVVDAHQRLPGPEAYDLIVPLGSDDSAYDTEVSYLDAEFELLRTAVDQDIPVFGICFGAQLLSRVLGGEVWRSPEGPEIGWITVESSRPWLVETGPWLTWHLDVMTSPPAAEELARSDHGAQAFVWGRHLATQFHPEATPESVRAWATKYSAPLAEVGLDYTTIVKQAEATAADAQQRAHNLTDRVLEHATRADSARRRTAGPGDQPI